tara:strand:- start:7937 stop:8458 length:522 start_codon:yes stop_codon:yes gene_type:complete
MSPAALTTDEARDADIESLQRDDIPESTKELNHETEIPTLENAMVQVDKIDAALPAVRDLEANDKEMDDLADIAINTFDELMQLGKDAEERFAGEIFSNAARMLDTALTAKTNKINKKLKMIELQLKKQRQDQIAAKEQASGQIEAPIDGEGVVLSRNDLLDEINKLNIESES